MKWLLLEIVDWMGIILFPAFWLTGRLYEHGCWWP